MPAKHTKESFIAKAVLKHGEGLYNYSDVVYSGYYGKISIRCTKHDLSWKTTPNSHSAGVGCEQCSALTRKPFVPKNKKSHVDFIRQVIAIHGDSLDFTKAKYVGAHTKVKVVCWLHGEFCAVADSLLRGQGCKVCGYLAAAKASTKTSHDFITAAVLKHGGNYTYAQAEYVNAKTKITVTCRKHGNWTVVPSTHLGGSGCPKCADEMTSARCRQTNEEFIARCRLVWGDSISYSHTVYLGLQRQVWAVCVKHNKAFKQIASVHLAGCQACGECRAELKSHGERKLSDWFDATGIAYEVQKAFTTCRGPRGGLMPFDVYVPSANLLIELDGKQHFQIDGHFIRSVDDLLKRRFLDNLKTMWAEDHDYRLIRIRYDQIDQINSNPVTSNQ